jgi:hypothetical protein
MKERPHITRILFPIYFFVGVSEVADCMFLLFHFFKRQTWAQTFFFYPFGVYRVRSKMHVLVNFLHEFLKKSLIGKF